MKFKAKYSAFAAAPLCLGNILKDWSVNNMKKTGLNGYVYEFCVDYEVVNPSPLLNNPQLDVTKNMSSIHNCFMLKYKIK